MSSAKELLLRVLTAAAGVPMNLDQILDQMPTGADRAQIDSLCRELRHDGVLTSSVEEGRVAYALDDSKPANTSDNVHQMPPRRRAIDRKPLAEQIRELLRDAVQPMTVEQVAAALPDKSLDQVQRALHNGAHTRQLVSVPSTNGARAKAYALRGGDAVAIAIATCSAPSGAEQPATAPTATTQPAARHKTSQAPEKPARATGTSEHDHAVEMAEAALKRYVESCVDQHVYQTLQASVSAAVAARAHHLKGGKP